MTDMPHDKAHIDHADINESDSIETQDMPRLADIALLGLHIEERKKSYQQATDRHKALVAKKNAEISALTERNKSLSQRVVALENSTSWKVTKPLRWLTKALKRPFEP